MKKFVMIFFALMLLLATLHEADGKRLIPDPSPGRKTVNGLSKPSSEASLVAESAEEENNPTYGRYGRGGNPDSGDTNHHIWAQGNNPYTKPKSP
ncbi:ribonuclease HII [Corchorus olitorius]|uniref:Ribonuclease HII n=1 Tax=Corchorus olitorius TaxID=93759 RepID=A0A1R3GKA8_9ROSI|nr:ribonuclease HII [Corchorus olitorius]